MSADGGGVDGRGLGGLVGRGLMRCCVSIGRYTYIHIHIWWGWVVGGGGGEAAKSVSIISLRGFRNQSGLADLLWMPWTQCFLN